jgi:hypothetical protein
MLATDAFNVLTIAVVKFASVENRFVDDALVVIELDEEAAPNEIDPALKLPPTLRSPEREVSPDTERESAETEPPESDAPVIEPLLIEGFVIAVPKSWSIAPAAAIVFGAPPPRGGEATAL